MVRGDKTSDGDNVGSARDVGQQLFRGLPTTPDIVDKYNDAEDAYGLGPNPVPQSSPRQEAF